MGAVLRETHSAVVVMIGDRAYKVKKPVDLGFLDFLPGAGAGQGQCDPGRSGR